MIKYKIRTVTWIVLLGLVGLSCSFISGFGNTPTPPPTDTPEPPAITNFDECVQAGNPVMESYPRQCRTQDGQTFTEDIGNALELMDFIRLDKPYPNQVIASPLIIEGKARGTWYFEADFPIRLYNANDEEIAVGFGTAQGEWMTEDFVSFSAELEFDSPQTSTGTLVLERDNPADLPDQDQKLVVPVKFEEP